jgi:hypothetical protein
VYDGDTVEMARQTVTVSHTVHVNRSPEDVFDYTQDYSRRMDWDPDNRDSELLSEEPRRIRSRIKGVGSAVVEYKLFRRPEKTSAAFIEVDSRYVIGGGGSWSYAAVDGGTDWTENNTIELKPGLTSQLLAPMVRRSLASSMRKSMATAKVIMESRPAT